MGVLCRAPSGGVRKTPIELLRVRSGVYMSQLLFISDPIGSPIALSQLLMQHTGFVEWGMSRAISSTGKMAQAPLMWLDYTGVS